MPAIFQNFTKGLVQTSLGSVDPRATTATEEYTLGTELIKKDQKWRYCKNGSVELAPGKLVQSSTLVANHHDLTPAVTAAGSKTVSVTLGATAATADQYAGGFLQIDDGAGEGFMYRVASHPAAAGGAALVVTLEEGLQVALAGASKVTLIANPWSGALVAASDLTAMTLGVATSTVAVDNYFWAQVSGPCSVLSTGAITVGLKVVRSGTDNGAVEVGADGNPDHEPIGTCMGTSEGGEYAAINLTIE